MNLISLILLIVVNITVFVSGAIVPFSEELELPDWNSINDTLENSQLIKERTESEQILINNVAFRGDAVTDYQIGLRQMNLFMRENYKKMIDRVGHNVYPLIVATDVDHDKRLAGTGSEYILFLRNGTIRHMKPTPSQYEQNKNLAHLPMSIFTIISPYFNNPTSPMWQDELQQLRTIISNNLNALDLLPKTVRPWTNHVFCEKNLEIEDHRSMLTLVLNYINSCIDSKKVDLQGYTNFTASYLPFVEKAMTCASQIQAKSAMIELSKWKHSLGASWRDVYVIIPVVWPVARLNPRQLIFEQLMDQDRIATHIVKAEGAQSIEEARTTAGRIIADRTMAHFVFGYNNHRNVDHNLALSTRRDLLATKAQNYLTRVVPTGAASAPGAPGAAGDEVEVQPNEIHFQNVY